MCYNCGEKGHIAARCGLGKGGSGGPSGAKGYGGKGKGLNEMGLRGDWTVMEDESDRHNLGGSLGSVESDSEWKVKVGRM